MRRNHAKIAYHLYSVAGEKNKTGTRTFWLGHGCRAQETMRGRGEYRKRGKEGERERERERGGDWHSEEGRGGAGGGGGWGGGRKGNTEK